MTTGDDLASAVELPRLRRDLKRPVLIRNGDNHHRRAVDARFPEDIRILGIPADHAVLEISAPIHSTSVQLDDAEADVLRLQRVNDNASRYAKAGDDDVRLGWLVSHDNIVTDYVIT